MIDRKETIVTWFKVDDNFADHPKVISILGTETKEVACEAIALWVMCGSWCGKHLNDGMIPRYLVQRCIPGGGFEGAKALVRAGLWVAHEDGNFSFHQWADHQPLRDSVLSKRASDSQRKKEARESKSLKSNDKKRPSGIRAESERNPSGFRSTRPGPTRPDPTREIPDQLGLVSVENSEPTALRPHSMSDSAHTEMHARMSQNLVEVVDSENSNRGSDQNFRENAVPVDRGLPEDVRSTTVAGTHAKATLSEPQAYAPIAQKNGHCAQEPTGRNPELAERARTIWADQDNGKCGYLFEFDMAMRAKALELNLSYPRIPRSSMEGFLDCVKHYGYDEVVRVGSETLSAIAKGECKSVLFARMFVKDGAGFDARRAALNGECDDRRPREIDLSKMNYGSDD